MVGSPPSWTQRPELPIVATSGFGEAWERDLAAPRCVFLPKPFDIDALGCAVEDALRMAPL